MKSPKRKKFDISVSLGHDTLVQGRYILEAKDELEAYRLASYYLLGSRPAEVQEVFKRKGLMYFPYFYVHKVLTL